MTNKLIVNLWRGEGLPSFSEDAYGPIDVLRLWRGAKRCITDLEMHVLCDDYYLEELVRYEEADASTMLSEIRMHPYQEHGIGGWSNVMESFRPDLFFDAAPSERILLVGLDTVFVSCCEWLYRWDLAPIGLPMDPYSGGKPCDAVVTFNALGAQTAWNEYLRAKVCKPFPYLLFGKPSEMVLLRQLFKDHNWNYLEDGFQKLRSLKGCRLIQDTSIPPGTSIVYLHGKPKLPDLPSNHPVRVLWEQAE